MNYRHPPAFRTRSFISPLKGYTKGINEVIKYCTGKINTNKA